MSTVLPGLEVLIRDRMDLLRGKRVGLVTHPAGVGRDLRTTLDVLARHEEVTLVALYGPEHGVRGNAQAGEYVPYYMDDKYRLPVFSLYGQTQEPTASTPGDLDQVMRTFDTQDTGKRPEHRMLQDVQALVIDLQDVGTRVYTYVATMAYALEAAAAADIEVIVLDRPNPITGAIVEGPGLDYPAYSSFVGLYPVPLRHGLTLGELARLVNARFLKTQARLTVVPMRGWRRAQWFDETQLPWVMPSPNIPTPETATVYPGQVLFEGTNVSEGRGTTRPFELIGAPWIDGFTLAARLDALRLPGVAFREAWFTPAFSKFAAERCGGVQLHVVDRRLYRSVATTVQILATIMALYPDRVAFHLPYFDKIAGSNRLRLALEERASLSGLLAAHDADAARFLANVDPFLLY